MAVKADGSLVCWGDDDQVSNTPTTAEFVAVAAGVRHSVAVKKEGSLASWGDDIDGQVSNTPTTAEFVTVTAGNVHISVWKWQM